MNQERLATSSINNNEQGHECDSTRHDCNHISDDRSPDRHKISFHSNHQLHRELTSNYTNRHAHRMSKHITLRPHQRRQPSHSWCSCEASTLLHRSALPWNSRGLNHTITSGAMCLQTRKRFNAFFREDRCHLPIVSDISVKEFSATFQYFHWLPAFSMIRAAS
jgi:hypothetical protein